MVKLDIEHDVVPHCIDNHKAILAYSPLERGLLTGKMKPGYKFQEGDHRAGLYFFTDENIRRTNKFLKQIKPIADSKKITVSQLVLRWTIEQLGITIALAGARNAFQAIVNAKASDVKLTSEEIIHIDHHLSKLEIENPSLALK
jgi:aryl-alcohol dehydrogenase-like predicted oxidoreductase